MDHWSERSPDGRALKDYCRWLPSNLNEISPVFNLILSSSRYTKMKHVGIQDWNFIIKYHKVSQCMPTCFNKNSKNKSHIFWHRSPNLSEGVLWIPLIWNLHSWLLNYAMWCPSHQQTNAIHHSREANVQRPIEKSQPERRGAMAPDLHRISCQFFPVGKRTVHRPCHMDMIDNIVWLKIRYPKIH